MSALPDRSRIRGRVLLLAALLAALLIVAAAVFLPPGVLRLAALGFLALPILCVFFDRPSLVFYLLVLILFSNIDLFTTFRLYRVILAIGVFSLGLAVLNGRRLIWHHHVMLILIAAFSLISFQSISVARNYDAAIELASRYFKHLVVLAMALQFVRTRREFRIYLLVIAAAILLNDLAPLVLTVPSRLNSLSLIWEQGVFRYEGFVLEPNAFAMIQLMLIPLLVYLIVVSRRSKVAVVLLSAAILVALASLVLSFSRGGFIGLAVLLILMLAFGRKSKAVVAISVMLFVAIVALLPREYWQRMSSMIGFMQGNRFDLSIYTRIESMKEAMHLGLANPLLGIGVGNFMYASGNMLGFMLIVHNAFLQVFAEVGVTGFVAFIVIIAYNVLIIRSLMRRRDPEVALLGRMLLLQLCASLVSAFFIPVAFEYFFWFLIAFPPLADYCFRESDGAEEAGRAGLTGAGKTF